MQGLLLAGRYRLVESIGSGGMGRVWRAHDEVLHRPVAIKELTAALYVTESDRAVLLARTHAEARAAARINHPAVVTVHDVLEYDNRPWIVMELVEGGSLADAVKERGRLEDAEAARIGLWVLRALRAAHSAGVLHRDVKPGNVLLAADGRVLLTDFGIAQVEGDTTITRTGEIVGSVDYLAPERLRGHDPGPASDLWALGATLYTAVEGRSAFRRTSPLMTMQAVVEEEPPPPQFAGALGPVIEALLCKDPAQRPHAEQAEQMLAEAAEGRRPKAAQEFVPTLHVDLASRGDTTTHVPRAHQAREAQTAGGTEPRTTASPASPPTRRKGRHGRTVVLVLAVAAVVGVAVPVWKHMSTPSPADPLSSSASPSASPSAVPSASPTKSRQAASAVPDGWQLVKDPVGFSLVLPKGWKRQASDGVKGNLQQIDYSPDNGKHLVRVAVDSSPDFNDPYDHQVDLDQQLRQRLVDYKQVSLKRDSYRDRDGSRWEYTWTALAKDTKFPGPYRAVDEMYIARDGVEYAIYMAAPAADWATTREQFETVLQGWREP
ncbi:serine/threonine-protein kinase [Streptomyces yaanensis]|uniref:non-specific serine/threonine protein kinase n=1 Tax=Streptomyces yaanensis TaxID=1142239 RepID=A0ABV7SPG2_9ACTN|nr:serine/threonine-protein kinase [Streptomyces sp. CGMCC 4.7035]WNC03000.1 serine/threonine-protein kinase [Streptomyces sp. CGMCC 4.7035]